MLPEMKKRLGKIISRTVGYSKSKRAEITQCLAEYDSGHMIYPSTFANKLQIPTADAYRILEAASAEGVIEGCYEYRCRNCQRVLGAVHLFNGLPETIHCNMCGSTMNTLENTFKIYKVV